MHGHQYANSPTTVIVIDGGPADVRLQTKPKRGRRARKTGRLAR